MIRSAQIVEAELRTISIIQSRRLSSDLDSRTVRRKSGWPPFDPPRKPELTYSDPIVGPFRQTCYIDRNMDSRFDVLWVSPGMIGFTYDLAPPPRYRKGQISNSGSGFKYELLYQGVDGKTLRVGYREYIDNLARAAFYQSLTYPLKTYSPTTIRFKSVRIEVLAADASEISYRVVSGFAPSAAR